jgi:hypothetical protein
VCAFEFSTSATTRGGSAAAAMTGGREELEAHRLGDLLRAQHRAGRDGDARHRHTRELEPDLSGRRLRAVEPVAEHLRQRHDALALRGRDEA